jgi:hypothetical protein
MGGHGEIRLRNDGTARKLAISGWIPRELTKSSPTIELRINDYLLDRFVESKREFEWEYQVGPAILGASSSVLLQIDTSLTARAPGDPRELGVSIEQVGWAPDRP